MQEAFYRKGLNFSVKTGGHPPHQKIEGRDVFPVIYHHRRTGLKIWGGAGEWFQQKLPDLSVI